MTIAICIATGASVTQADVDFCKGRGKVYAVKEAYLMAPWADALYCADEDWWASKKGVPDFAGEKWTVSHDAARVYGLKWIAGTSDIEWGQTDKLIAYGGNSGFQAFNLSVVQGAKKVILLGYDYGLSGDTKHWFDNTEHKRESRPSNYATWTERMHKAARHIPVPVINCSPRSAIKCFPKMSVQEAFGC